jgi:hypothetical protein
MLQRYRVQPACVDNLPTMQFGGNSAAFSAAEYEINVVVIDLNAAF